LPIPSCRLGGDLIETLRFWGEGGGAREGGCWEVVPHGRGGGRGGGEAQFQNKVGSPIEDLFRDRLVCGNSLLPASRVGCGSLDRFDALPGGTGAWSPPCPGARCPARDGPRSGQPRSPAASRPPPAPGRGPSRGSGLPCRGGPGGGPPAPPPPAPPLAPPPLPWPPALPPPPRCPSSPACSPVGQTSPPPGLIDSS